jgi:hypothetical protein
LRILTTEAQRHRENEDKNQDEELLAIVDSRRHQEIFSIKWFSLCLCVSVVN